MFGEGKIRVEITFDDGSHASAKVPYIGDINTLDVVELKNHVKRLCLVEYGRRATGVNIIGWY
jgi:hypothetical protein